MSLPASPRWAEAAAITAAWLLAIAATVGPVLSSPPGIDEQVTAYLAAGTAPDSVFRRCQTQSATPPLYFWLARGSWEAATSLGLPLAPEAALRLPAWLAYLAAMPLAAWLAHRAVPGSGPAAAWLLAGHPWAREHAVAARPYALGLFLLLLAAWRLAVYQQRGGWLRWLALALAIAALPWTHYLFAAHALALLPLALLAGRPRRWGGLLGAAVVAMALALPLAAGAQRVAGLRDVLAWITVSVPATEPLQLLRPGPAAFLALLPTLALLGYGFRRWSGAPAPADRRIVAVAALLAAALAPAMLLWSAGQYLGPTLAQPRYAAPLAGLAAAAMAAALHAAAGRRLAWLAVAGLLAVDAVPWQVAEILRQPVRHDTFWLDAAARIRAAAGPQDLVLAQTGLVETAMVPAAWDDAAFHEYCTSRLGPLHGPLPARKALPLFFAPGPWSASALAEISRVRAAGGRVWLVFSADSDIGQRAQDNALAWLADAGFAPSLVSDLRVARLFSVPGLP